MGYDGLLVLLHNLGALLHSLWTNCIELLRIGVFPLVTNPRLLVPFFLCAIITALLHSNGLHLLLVLHLARLRLHVFYFLLAGVHLAPSVALSLLCKWSVATVKMEQFCCLFHVALLASWKNEQGPRTLKVVWSPCAKPPCRGVDNL